MERNDNFNPNFDSTLKKVKQKAQKAIRNRDFTEFFVLNKQRKVIEFLLTTQEKLLLEFYLHSLIPEEMREFVHLELRNEEEEKIIHWYFDEELVIFVLHIDWGDNKQEISIEVDSEQFEVLVANSGDLGIRILDYKMLNDFMVSFIRKQAEMISNTFNSIKEENEKAKNKPTLENFF